MEDDYRVSKGNRRNNQEADRRRMPKHGYSVINLDITIVTPAEKALRKKAKKKRRK